MSRDASAPDAPSGDSPQPLPWPLMLGRLLLLTLAYFAVGYASAMLLRQTYVAAPVCLYAGIALAALMCWGQSVAPAVFAGHVLLVGAISLGNGSQSLVGALGFGLGAMLQALFGNWLIGRVMQRPFELRELADVARFVMIAGAVTPLSAPPRASPRWSTPMASMCGSRSPGIWLDLWLSNGIGVLVTAPVMLALLAQPREIWAPRLLTLALPLLLAALLLTFAIIALARWDNQRQFVDFRRNAEVAANSIENAVREPLAVLAAARGLLAAQPEVGQAGFQAATERFSPRRAARWNWSASPNRSLPRPARRSRTGR